MIPSVDETHEPSLRSWVESAEGHRDFPIQNLPLGVFMPRGAADGRIGVAIGEMVLDVPEAVRRGLLRTGAAPACTTRTLNALMALDAGAWRELRRALSELLRVGTKVAPADRAALLHRQADVDMQVPAAIGDYSDFYASIHHATNVGRMFRPDNPLLPNYKYVPIGYHGRASSIVASGTAVRRPIGQWKAPDAEAPVFGPSRSLDYECEVGAFVGRGNALGEPLPLASIGERLFGLCLVNDWSARDVQSWEYQPLGPFLSKSFATTVSPWVVTADALAPFRIAAMRRPDGDPEPLPYLRDEDDARRGGVDIGLEVLLLTGAMRAKGLEPIRISRARFADMYWTLGQMLAHHASNGCNLRPGDLIASGTVSGAEPDARGCLLELTSRGATPLDLPGGETRAFLEDGDEVIIRGRCSREGFVPIGFGECRGTVLPAPGAGAAGTIR